MEKRWKIAQPDQQQVLALQSALKVHPVLCTLLVERGITNFEQAHQFFRPELQQLHSPWIMKDMEKAVARIEKGLATQESMMVFGDYDVDGTTSVAMMYRFLKTQYHGVSFYIPHRYREGYGISQAGIDHAAAQGISLIIALDCGIKSVELVAYAKNLGIDFIICDHHLPGETLPDAAAILNPKQKNCPYPYKELCGCGVGFKLICALVEKWSLPQSLAWSYLDLVATAIAADIVPITGENRILAYFGIEKVNRDPNPGIQALIQLSGATPPIQITKLVFLIAPRVNAAGRMDDAKKAVELFVADDKNKALEFAELLHSDNSDRKEADVSITEEALRIIVENPEWAHRNSTVVYQPHWHKGVVGIVASRLIEHHYRPTIVLTSHGEHATGSARSIPGFNLHEAIHACRSYLITYGGHFAAAGLTLLKSDVDAFREKFEEVVTHSIDETLLIPALLIDAEIRFGDIKPSFFKILQQMEPFGPANMAPVFIARKITDTGQSRILKDKHIKFSITQDGIPLSGIGFNMADKFSVLERGQPFDMVFKIDENEWNGQKCLQLKVEDIRPA